MKPCHTLLVVDDEPDVLQSVKDLLRLDYKVLTATRAVDGMKIMEQEEVHIVMTDQRMPGTSGVEFLHNVRGEFPEAIRLLFTGYADIRAVIDAINAGSVYRYITKPWDPEELQSVIREACERYDLIAERKRLTEDLKVKNRELESANKELREASELKSAFIQVASHELRTPLTILMGLSDLAIRVPEVNDPLKSWLERMKAASNRLMRLVDQIITMLSAGKFDNVIEKVPTDLANLLTQAVDDVQPFIELRRQTIEHDWPADIGKVPLEPVRMRDGINHLLLNAIKFTPDGGKITIRASRTADGGAQIIVSDTGVGINTAALAHVFEPFFTGFNVEHHSSGMFEYGRQGLGLGLSVVKAFVDMHGGNLQVQSEPGKGTTFTITLPGR
jgi:signal transduction histidine kinase